MLEKVKQMALLRGWGRYRSDTHQGNPRLDNERIIEEAQEEIAKSQATNEDAERLLEYFAALADVRLWEKE